MFALVWILGSLVWVALVVAALCINDPQDDDKDYTGWG